MLVAVRGHVCGAHFSRSESLRIHRRRHRLTENCADYLVLCSGLCGLRVRGLAAGLLDRSRRGERQSLIRAVRLAGAVPGGRR